MQYQFRGNQYIKIRKVKTSIKIFTTIAIILVACYIGYKSGVNSYEKIILNDTSDTIIDNSSEMFKNKINALKDDLVIQLENCERYGHNEDDGLITYDPQKGERDSNKIPSIGLLQFKKTTIQYYYNALYGKTLTGKESVLLALDVDKSRSLAKDIMFNTKNAGTMDWVTCYKKNNILEQIKLIKNLENK